MAGGEVSRLLQGWRLLRPGPRGAGRLSCVSFHHGHYGAKEEQVGPSTGEGITLDSRQHVGNLLYLQWIVGQPGKVGLSVPLDFSLFPESAPGEGLRISSRGMN